MSNRIVSAGIIRQLKEQLNTDDELHREFSSRIESVLIDAEVEDTKELAEEIILRLIGDE